MENFKLYSQYYDLLYKDKDYKSEADYVINILRAHNPNVKNIIELGCGSGGHAPFITAKGISLTGIERSSHMVAEAKKKKIANFRPIQGDISVLKINQEFDAAISLFHVISYLTTNEQLLACFRNTWQHLKSNGLFLFDVWFAPAVFWLKPERREKVLENDTIKVNRTAESTVFAEKNVVEVNFSTKVLNKQNGIVSILKEKHPMRCFSVPEIELLAIQCGFQLVKTEEFLSQAPLSCNTWGACFILKKI